MLRHAIRKLLDHGERVAFLKIDVQFAEEDELLAREFGIPTRKVYSGELCPDHCSVMVLGDAMEWADKRGCNILLVETAGLCLRCSPYVDGGLGICVLEATSGMNLPLKVGPMLSLADVCRRDQERPGLASRARGVSRRIQDVAPWCRSARPTRSTASASTRWSSASSRRPRPATTCCCAAIRRWAPAPSASARSEVGWQSHFGVVRALDNLNFYRGQ